MIIIRDFPSKFLFLPWESKGKGVNKQFHNFCLKQNIFGNPVAELFHHEHPDECRGVKL